MPKFKDWLGKARDGIGIGAQGVGAAAAHLQQVPVVGSLFVSPVAFVGANIQKGYRDTLAVIHAKKAVSGGDPEKAAEAGLTDEQKERLEKAAKEVKK